MKETPLLFSGDMVRAYHAGRKTVTRRLVRAHPGDGCPAEMWPYALRDIVEWREQNGNWFGLMGWRTLAVAAAAYGAPGDRIWGRESWRVGKPHDWTRPGEILAPLVAHGQGVTVLYEAGGWRSVGPAARDEPTYPNDEPMPPWAGKGRPSIHMPRAFSRILLDIVSVRIERLQDITEADATDEGVSHLRPGSPYWRNYQTHTLGPSCIDYTCLDARESYRSLWDSLNEKRGHGWDTNPWIWRISFPRFVAPAAQVAA